MDRRTAGDSNEARIRPNKAAATIRRFAAEAVSGELRARCGRRGGRRSSWRSSMRSKHAVKQRGGHRSTATRPAASPAVAAGSARLRPRGPARGQAPNCSNRARRPPPRPGEGPRRRSGTAERAPGARDRRVRRRRRNQRLFRPPVLDARPADLGHSSDGVSPRHTRSRPAGAPGGVRRHGASSKSILKIDV